MDRRQFFQAASLPAIATVAAATSAQAEGYRRCDQLHEKILPDEIDKWQMDLPIPIDTPVRKLVTPTGTVTAADEFKPVPPIGQVAQGAPPEWYWLPEAAGTQPPPGLAKGDDQPRPHIFRQPGEAGRVQYAELHVRDFVSSVIPGWLTRQLGFAPATFDGQQPIPTVPGPKFEVRLGQPLVVRVTNKIDPKLMLDISVHQHGGHTPAHSDGHPNFLILPAEGIHPPQSRDYYYPNPVPLFVDHPAENEWVPRDPADPKNWDMHEVPSTMWYHDHAEDITAHNALMGLGGLFFLRDNVEDDLRAAGKLPDREHEIPLVFKDVCFCRITDSSMIDPKVKAEIPNEQSAHPERRIYGEARIHFDPFDHNGTLGNIVLVNGAAFPKMTVRPEAYWLRMLNASLARFYNFEFWVIHPKTRVPQRIPFWRFGKDSWMFEHPQRQSSVFLGMANRGDVLLDFSDLLSDEWKPFRQGSGTDEHLEVLLVSTLNQKDGRGPGHGDNELTTANFPRGMADEIQDDRKAPLELVKFVVTLAPKPEAEQPPRVQSPVKMSEKDLLRPHELIELPKPGLINVREFNFERGRGAWQVNHKFYDSCRADAVSQLWSTELWILRNRSGGWWHPIHIHLESQQHVFIQARNQRGERIAKRRPGYDPHQYDPERKFLEPDDLKDELEELTKAYDRWLESFPWQKGEASADAEMRHKNAAVSNFDDSVWNIDIKHDTTVLGPNTEVHLLMRFRTFQGPFVFHCHNLNHEDMRMMKQMDPRMALSQPQDNLCVRPDFWFFTKPCDEDDPCRCNEQDPNCRRSI